MKAIRFACVGLAVSVAAVALMSCQPALLPFYTEKDVIEMPGITGAWMDVDGRELWTIVPNELGGYRVLQREDDVDKAFDLHCFQLDGIQYVDISLSKSEDDEGNDELLLPTHLAGTIAVGGDSLVLRILDAFWVESMAKRGELTVPFTQLDDGIVLTGRTEELQKYLRENINEDAAFTYTTYYRTQSPALNEEH